MPRLIRPTHAEDVCVSCEYPYGRHYGTWPHMECPTLSGVTWVTWPTGSIPPTTRRDRGERVYSHDFRSRLLTGVHPLDLCDRCHRPSGLHRSSDARCPRPNGEPSRRPERTYRASPLPNLPLDLPHAFTATWTPTQRARWPGIPGVVGYNVNGRDMCIRCARNEHNVTVFMDSVPVDVRVLERDGNGLPLDLPRINLVGALSAGRGDSRPGWCNPLQAQSGCAQLCTVCFYVINHHEPSDHGWCDCGSGEEDGNCSNCDFATPDVDEDEPSVGCRCDHCVASSEWVRSHPAPDPYTLRAAPEVTDADIAAMVAAFEDPELTEA